MKNKLSIPSNQFKLLIRIFRSKKCFDQKDNTFKLSNRKIATHLKVAPSSVDQLMRTLSKRELTRYVTTLIDTVLMLKPELLFKKPRRNYWYAKGLWFFRDHDKTIQWIDLCWYYYRFVDFTTGEMKRKPKLEYIFDTTRHYSSGYNEFILQIQNTHPESPCKPYKYWEDSTSDEEVAL